MNAHERALGLVLEALCAACVVVTVLAAAAQQAWWSALFAVCAFACYEVRP